MIRKSHTLLIAPLMLLLTGTAFADAPVWHGSAKLEGLEVGRDMIQLHLPAATSTHLCPDTDSNKWFVIDRNDPKSKDMLPLLLKAMEPGWKIDVRSNAPTCFDGYIRVEILQLFRDTSS